MAFGNYPDMAVHPDIDLICVVTSVMHHHALVLQALEAGKQFFVNGRWGSTHSKRLICVISQNHAGFRPWSGFRINVHPLYNMYAISLRMATLGDCCGQT
jgi:hypothetical protein